MAKTKLQGKSETASTAPVARKSVDIKKANNGYVVSQWSNHGDGEKIYIAKTQKEAQARAGKLLKM